jgi:hypothetical protein
MEENTSREVRRFYSFVVCIDVKMLKLKLLCRTKSVMT